MSDVNTLREKIAGLSDEQMQQVAGGECTVSEWITAFTQLTDAYENLVDFTSHVIERVAGP